MTAPSEPPAPPEALPPEMWAAIAALLDDAKTWVSLADVSQATRAGVAAQPGVYLVDSDAGLTQALGQADARYIIVVRDGLTLNAAPVSRQAKVITRRAQMTVTGGVLYLAGESASATVTGGEAHAFAGATITSVTGNGRALAYGSASIGSVTGNGSAYAYGSASIGSVTGNGSAYAEDSATIVSVSGGWATADHRASIGSVSSGEARAHDEASIGWVSGGEATAYDNATIERASGQARIYAQDESRVNVDAGGEAVVVEAVDRAVVTALAGTVEAHDHVTVVTEGARVISHGRRVTVQGAGSPVGQGGDQMEQHFSESSSDGSSSDESSSDESSSDGSSSD